RDLRVGGPRNAGGYARWRLLSTRRNRLPASSRSTGSGEQEIVGVQAAGQDVLQGDRVVDPEADHGVGTDLMHAPLHRQEIRKHAAVELDVIAMLEIGEDILAEARAERERVVAATAGHGVVAASDAEHIVASRAGE